MDRLISQAWNWLLGILLKQTVLILTLMFCLGISVALAHMHRLSSNLITSQALHHAELSAQAINDARTLYSETAASRASKVSGITVDYNYKDIEGGIPNPATYVIELGDHISDNMPGTLIRLYSDYPFPHRQEEGGPKDDFEREALVYLRQNPQKQFYRVENYQGSQALRYAQADIMKASCVECHNSHSQSPKKDWKVGDVRGILEVTQTFDALREEVNNGLQGSFVTLGGLSILGVSGLTLVISRLRRTTKDLEYRVRERTADLATANQDLERRNQLISQVFGRYLSTEVVSELLEKPEELRLGGQRKKITILTSDLRGFTALSEQLAPEEVVKILNLYLKYMSEVITQYHGTIDKFMGDGILVLFGAPHARNDDIARAVACAVAMQLAIVTVNDTVREWGYPSLEMGIGINTGDVVVGNIGSEQRTDYSVVGNQVNLTYRIESYTVGGQILISESTFQQVQSIVKVSKRQKVQPKGVKQPITVYEVEGVGGEYNLFLPPQTEVFRALEQVIPIKYTLLEGKHLGANVFSGALIELSAKGAKIRSHHMRKDDVPPQLSNIKLNLLHSIAPKTYSEDIYAKVIAVETEQKIFVIRFTSQPSEVKAKLEQLYDDSVS